MKPLQNCTSGKMVAAYQKRVDRLKAHGSTPKQHVLNNEISDDFKRVIKDN